MLPPNTDLKPFVHVIALPLPTHQTGTRHRCIIHSGSTRIETLPPVKQNEKYYHHRKWVFGCEEKNIIFVSLSNIRLRQMNLFAKIVKLLEKKKKRKWGQLTQIPGFAIFASPPLIHSIKVSVHRDRPFPRTTNN